LVTPAGQAVWPECGPVLSVWVAGARLAAMSAQRGPARDRSPHNAPGRRRRDRPRCYQFVMRRFGQGVWRGHWAGDLQKDNGVIRRVD